MRLIPPDEPADLGENRTIMTTLLNVIWLVFSGVWLFLGYMLAAVIMFVLIITIP